MYRGASAPDRFFWELALVRRMLRVRVEEQCRDKTAMLALLLRDMPLSFAEAEGEVVVPCDIVESEHPEFLVPVFVSLKLKSVKQVEVGIDPGASRSGIVILAGDEVVYKGVLPTSKISNYLDRLSRYYQIRVFLGKAACSNSLEVFRWRSHVEVVEVEEKDLPLIEGESIEHGKEHEVDAFRILLKGRLIKLRESLENARARKALM